MSYRYPLAEFTRMVREAVESLPAEFLDHMDNVVVDVEDEPNHDQQQRLASRSDPGQIEDESGESHELLGLFIGVPKTDQEYGDALPNRVVIFRGPHERSSRNREALLKNLRATVLHELAHHFGFDEDDLSEFEESQGEWLD